MRLPNLRPNTLVGACDDRESQGVSCCGLCRLDTCVSVIGVFGGLPVEARARGPFATFGFLLVGDWCTFEYFALPIPGMEEMLGFTAGDLLCGNCAWCSGREIKNYPESATLP